MTTLANSHPAAFRILSLDGGGIRGAFTAAFLADIEERLACRVCDYFDLIAGTSTGGIIAAALASGEPASKIVNFYREHGPRIFTRAKQSKGLMRGVRDWFTDRLLRRHGIDSDWLRSPKYNAGALLESLEGVFGERTIESLRCRIVIPSMDLTKGQTVVFKTPHRPDLFRDRGYRIVDVISATTAAPTYFPHATFGAGGAYVDGGVWANNPTMVALVEALRIGRECRRPRIDPIFELDSVQILSVGTGEAKCIFQPPERGGGVAWWLAGPLIELVGMSQAQGVHFQSEYVLDDRYHRVDFDLPDKSWKLDCTDVINQLIHIGHEKAVEQLASIRPTFFRARTIPYVPFDVPQSSMGDIREPKAVSCSLNDKREEYS